MFIKHRKPNSYKTTQTQCKIFTNSYCRHPTTHTPPSVSTQRCSQTKHPIHIYTSTAHRPTRTETQSPPNVLYCILSQFGEPGIKTTHAPKIFSVVVLSAHRRNLGKKTCRPRAVTPKEAHTPHSTPLSTVLQSGEPGITAAPIHQRFPVLSFCTQTKFGKKDLQTSGSPTKRSSHTS